MLDRCTGVRLTLLMGVTLVLLVASCGDNNGGDQDVATSQDGTTGDDVAVAGADVSSPGDAQTEPDFEVAKSDKARIQAPLVVDGDKATFTKDNRAFAFDVYQKLKDEDGNLFFSPHSISAALAMTWAGAKSATATQMADCRRAPRSALSGARRPVDGLSLTGALDESAVLL